MGTGRETSGSNLLLLHGFERQRPPVGQSGSSQYTLLPSGDLKVRLWGFGLYFGAETGIFINRFEFVPREARINDLWQAQEMTGLPRARSFSLFVQALRWSGAYEHWVLRTFGIEYRKACLRGWEAATPRPDRISDSWNELASFVERPSSFRRESRVTTGCRSSGLPDAEDRVTYTPRTHHKGRTRDRLPGSPAAASV